MLEQHLYLFLYSHAAFFPGSVSYACSSLATTSRSTSIKTCPLAQLSLSILSYLRQCISSRLVIGQADLVVAPLHAGVASPDSRSRGAQSGQQGANLTPASPAPHTQASQHWTASTIPAQCLWSNVPAGARCGCRGSDITLYSCVTMYVSARAGGLPVAKDTYVQSTY